MPPPATTASAPALVFLAFCSLLPALAMADSKLDISEEDREANAVRRKGVDSALIRYAAIALQQASSGTIVDVALPPGILGGIEAQALLLEAEGSAVVPQTFDEFSFPQGSVVAMDSLGNDNTTAAAALLLYRRIIDFTVYALPPPYQFLGPPVGLLAFPYSISVTAAMDSTQTPLQELPVSVPTNELIHISLPSFSPSPSASISSPLCALFVANGSIFVSSVAAAPNICTTDTLGDYALIYQPSSSPSPPNPTAPSARPSSPSPKPSSKNSKLVIAAVCISLAGLTFIVALALISVKLAEGIRRAVLARFSKNEETLQMSLVGSSRAPSAMVVRTKPTLEMDAADFNGVPP